MNTIKTTLSKGAIDRIGSRIRSSSQIEEDVLLELQNYRTSFKDSLSSVFESLCKHTRSISRDSIVSYRIKRIESITGKLRRYPEMRFSRMWDIGGCRCIMRSDREVYRLSALIHENYKVIKVYDYISEPQTDGYKSLHLFIQCEDSNVIEIQLRNQDNHNWATLVEITDIVFDAKLKEYGENKELQRFHYLLSKKDVLTIAEKKEIADITTKYQYFTKLSHIFARNYLEVRRQWLDIEDRPAFKFFLLETKLESAPVIISFHNFNDAEKSYFDKYKNYHNANIVLTHLPTPSYKHMSMAYSNYILTYHSFQDDLFKIIEELIIDSLSAENFKAFIKYFNYYSITVTTFISNLQSEILTISTYSNARNKKTKSKQKKKEKEWDNDIKKQISKRTYAAKQLQKRIHENWPNSLFRKFLALNIVRIISIIQKRRINKIIHH